MDEKLENQARFEEKMRWVQGQLEKKIAKAKARLSLHLEEKEEAKRWPEQTHLAELLQSHFYLLRKGMHAVVVEDWGRGGEKREIPLDPVLEPQEIVKRCFKQARKLRRKAEIMEILIQKAQDEITQLSSLIAELKASSSEQAIDSVAAQARLIRPKERAQKQEKKHPYREFITEAGLHIFVGRRAKDNDELSFRFAHGNDYWFHAANTPGSHVVLKVPKGTSVDEQSLQDALQLALHFSQAKKRVEDEVTMTECKFLSKSKGAKPGQVNVSRHKRVLVKIDPKRLQRLLKKLV